MEISSKITSSITFLFEDHLHVLLDLLLVDLDSGILEDLLPGDAVLLVHLEHHGNKLFDLLAPHWFGREFKGLDCETALPIF